MTTVYFRRIASRQKELAFFEFLKTELGDINHVNETYPLPPLLESHIDIPKTIIEIENDLLLPLSKKLKSIAALKTLPDKVLVARTINEVSVDFTLIRNNRIYFIEFHEKQHSRLSVSRPTPIFCLNNERHEIPRFTQRLLKDLWRWRNLPNLKVVWWDWFELNKNSVSVEFLLESKSSEFYMEGKFCFSNFRNMK